MRILIVEDDFVSKELLKAIIQRLGFDIEFAADGEEGFDRFITFKPNIVITDIRMPKMDGIELLQKIRQVEKDCIIILITAHGNEEIAFNAFYLGANNYLKKPINTDELKNLLLRYKNIFQAAASRKDISNLVQNQSLDLHIDSNLDLIPSVAEFLTKKISHLFSPTEAISIELGLMELLLNAVEHGTFQISPQEKELAVKTNSLAELYAERRQNDAYKDKFVTIRFEQTPQECVWIITDQGEGFDYRNVFSKARGDLSHDLHGRGVLISQLQFDSVEYLGKGNKVKATKNIKI